MPDVEVNGVRLAYVDTGGPGEVVVFSHGLLWSRHMFAPQIEAMRRRWRCVAWDHRGQGESSVPSGRVATIDQCADDALALFDALGLDKVHFVGLSMGGFVGMRLAARHPERIRSLVLIATAADPEPPANAAKYRRLTWAARLLGVNRWLSDQVMPIMFGPTFLADPKLEELRQAWRARLELNSRSIYKAVNGVVERQGVEAELARITCPTLVLRGDEDAAIAEPRARALAAGIAGARYVGVSRAGHTATIENPHAVNAHVATFIEAV